MPTKPINKSNAMKYNILFYTAFSVLILLSLIFSFKKFGASFIFIFSNDHVKTRGVIDKIEKRNSVNADLSYDYSIRYRIDSKEFSIEYSRSITPLNYSVGDSILIEYSKSRPEIAYVEFGFSRYIGVVSIIFSIVVLLFSVSNLIKLLRKFFNSHHAL